MKAGLAAPGPAKRMKTYRFRNWGIVFLELAVAAAAFWFAARRGASPVGLIALVVGVYCLWSAFAEFRGVYIGRSGFAWPAKRLRWFPLVLSGRRKLDLEDVSEMTVAPNWAGHHILIVEGGFGTDLLMFSSRESRMKFFEAVKERVPNVKIYRFSW